MGAFITHVDKLRDACHSLGHSTVRDGHERTRRGSATSGLRGGLRGGSGPALLSSQTWHSGSLLAGARGETKANLAGLSQS